MSKKSYRTVPALTPGYPRLVDIDRRSVLDWGLVALGSLWLGSAGCTELGMRGKMAPTRLPDAGAADPRAPKPADRDAGSAPPLPPPPGGVPPPARIEPGKEDVHLGGKPTSPRMYDATPAAASDKPASVDVPTPGRARPSRLEDADQPKKKPKPKKSAKPKE
jgi:hypothetical protein